MPAPSALLDLYLNLAKVSEEQHRPQHRERFLALAASAANDAGDPVAAEACRSMIVDANPMHTFRRFNSAEEALGAVEVAEYIISLRRLYPFEKAEFLLQKYTDGVKRSPVDDRTNDDDSLDAAPAKRRRKRSPVKLASIGRLERRTERDFKPNLEWIAALQRPPAGMIPLSACLVMTAVGFAIGFVAAAMLGLFVH
jgi:hypothetical protein